MTQIKKINNSLIMEIICYSCGRGEFPENTLEGIANCQSINPEWRIEMDIQITKDGHLVLFHDYETKRVTGEHHLIAEMNLSEVQALNSGNHFAKDGEYIYRNAPLSIPLLQYVFEQFPKARFMLDVHTDKLTAVELLIALVEKYGVADNIIVVSKYDATIRAFKQQRPDWIYGVPTMEAKKMIYSSFLGLDTLFPIRSDILMLPQKAGSINILSRRVINHAKRRNKKLWVWMYEGEYVGNVNTKEDLLQMESLGADGVFTDYPSQLMGA